MKKNQILFWCFFVCSMLISAQNFVIKGKLLDEEKLTPLEAATVFVETLKDSTLITYTITDKKGNFELEGKTTRNKVKVYVSFVGYQSYDKEIVLDRKIIDLGGVKLPLEIESLDDVVVNAKKAPITIKKDTLEFNAASFKVKRDATVEDLLKKLPGVEVDEEGAIKVHGKDVNKILVNGKSFFGDDPTITTRNLTKDIIDKIQVSDTKTKSEAFAGEKGDKNNKTINITIKEENNKGVFGRIAAGGGTDERYQLAGIVNLFDNERRISVLLGGNNINSPGFSFGEVRKVFGGGSSVNFNGSGGGNSFAGGNGITTSRNIGANYADKIGEQVNITTDYFYSTSDSENKRKTERENILIDTRFFTDSKNESLNTSDNHKFNIALDVKVTPTLLINIRPSLIHLKSDNTQEDETFSRNENQELSNSSTSNSRTRTLGSNFKNIINLTKRLGDEGSFIRVSISNDVNETETERKLNSVTNTFVENPEEIIRNQLTEGEKTFNGLSTNFTYRLALVKKKVFLDFRYGFRYNERKNKESTFDFNEIDQRFSDFNTALSTDFTYRDIRKTPGIKLSYKEDNFSVHVNGGYVLRTLKNRDQLRNLYFEEDFNAIELGANADYQIGSQASVYVGYNLRNQPPNISQLQPFQNVTNPLNIVTGNPDLNPSNEHGIYFGMNSYNYQKGRGFYSYANVTITNNKVIPKTEIDESLVRRTTYANVNGDYRVYGSLSYNVSHKIDSIRKLRLKIGVSSNLNKAINYNNQDRYASRNWSITPNVGVTFNWKKVFEIRPNYRLTYTKNVYNIDAFDDREFINHSVGIKTATFVPKNVVWRNDVSFRYNPNVSPGFQQSAWFWNTSIAYAMLKDKGLLSLKIYDVLKQNNNARRTATANYIEDVESTVLEQYFMLSFSYKFNSLRKIGQHKNRNFYNY